MLRASVVLSLAYEYAVPQVLDLMLIMALAIVYLGVLWVVIRQG